MTAQYAFFMFAAVGVAGLVSLTLKQVIGRARPQHLEQWGAYHLDPLTFDPSFASFPSGHSTTIVALAVALGFLFPRGRILFYSVAGWVALSRVIVNAHYLSDVLAGSYIGAMTAIYVRWQFTRWRLLFEPTDDGVRFRAPALRRRLRHSARQALSRAGSAWPPWQRGALRRAAGRGARIFWEEAGILLRFLGRLARRGMDGFRGALQRIADWFSGKSSAAAGRVEGAAGSAMHRLARRLGNVAGGLRLGTRDRSHHDGP